MKVKELVNLISTCDVKRIFNDIRSKVKTDGTIDPGKDTGLPVIGECSISAFPIYFGSVGATDEFRVTAGQRISGAVKDKFPNSSKHISKWYCLDPQLRGYRTIPADKLPKFTRKVGYLGGYEVVVDPSMPGGNNDLGDIDIYPILADMVLRFDLKEAVREDAVKVGCKYLNGSAELAPDMPHIALLTRSDMAIEYDFRLHQWRDVPNLSEVSSLNNRTQHRDFVGICQPGRCNLSGEDIAKLVLSTQEAINILGRKYEANLDELITPTRFKVLHPIDTKGYFLRLSASTVATSSVKMINAPAISKFPIWFHDKILDKYYEMNLGFAQVGEAMVPANAVVAGTLGSSCEVLYDPDAMDAYDTKQLAYLAAYVMKSKFPTKDGDGVLAMYGCMEHLNSIFAPILMGNGADTLPEIKGTRIENLDPDPSAQVDFAAAFGLSTSCSKALIYSASTDSITQVSEAMINRELALTGECTRALAKSTIVANALVKFAGSNPFEVWEAGLRERLKMELVPAPAAYVDFFKEAPHVSDPEREANPGWLVLKVEDKFYTINSQYEWAELVTDAMPAGFMEAGPFFCGTLYCKEMDVRLDSLGLTSFLLSTAQYFVSFDRAPTVYQYLYNMDADSERWCIGSNGQDGDQIMLASPEAGVISYDPETHLWTHVPDGGDGEYLRRLGNFRYAVPDKYADQLTPGMLAEACRSLSICASGFRSPFPPTPVPKAFMYQRVVPKAVDTATWVAEFAGESYTGVDGDWALYTGPRIEESEVLLPAEDFISLVVDYIYCFVKFPDRADNQFTIFDRLFGGSISSAAEKVPDYELSGYMWLDPTRPLLLGTNGVFGKPHTQLPWKDRSESNIMGVSAYIESSIGVITLEDFANLISSLNHLNLVAEDYMSRANLDGVPALNAYRDFVSHQQALADMLERKITEKYEGPIVLTVGKYGWDGNDWHECSVSLAASAQSAFGLEVHYDPELRNMPIECYKAVRQLYVLTTLCWEPKPEYFPVLELVRRR